MAVAVGEHLELDVPRSQQVLLHQHPVVAEAGRGLALAAGERGGEILVAIDAPHAAAAAAGAGLDEHRVAEAIGGLLQPPRVLVLAVVARASAARRRAPCSALAADFEPIARIAAGGGPTKTRPCARAVLGEGGVLRQETVAGVDGLGAAALRRLEDARRRADSSPRPSARRWPTASSQAAHMPRIRVGVRVHRDRVDAHAARGARDAAGDFAAIGDQQALR